MKSPRHMAESFKETIEFYCTVILVEPIFLLLRNDLDKSVLKDAFNTQWLSAMKRKDYLSCTV